jgi:hypothetical protein
MLRQVCPAGWTPGGKTMVADPDKSLEYFHSVSDTAEEDFGAKLKVSLFFFTQIYLDND